MTAASRFALPCLLLWLAVFSATPATADEAHDLAFFSQHVAPLLSAECLSCHGSEKKGELDLRSGSAARAGGASGQVIAPGVPEESLLFEYVASGEMPPEGKLSDEQIAIFRRWIEQGAAYPREPVDPLAYSSEKRAGYDWWSLQPLESFSAETTSGLPARWQTGQTGQIDRLIGDRLQKAGLEPSPQAAPQTLLRRATYDLTGLPPTPEERSRFLNACRTETGHEGVVGERAYAQLIDRLLASPRYGERWGRHWLDVVRFAESRGFERNQIVNNVWPFRDYVIRSLNEDKPFDQLGREHLAGDTLGPGDPAVEIGTAFLSCGPYDDVSNQDPVRAAQIRADVVDEIIRTTGESFLGLTVGCSRCHDHKFDPISQKDYYQFYAIFSGIKHGSRLVGPLEERKAYAKEKELLKQKKVELVEQKNAVERKSIARGEARMEEYAQKWQRPPTSPQGNEETFAPVDARFVRLVIESKQGNPRTGNGCMLQEFEIWTTGDDPRNVALSAHGGEARGKARQARDFAGAYGPQLAIDGAYSARWIGYGNTLTIELAETSRIDRVVFATDRTGADAQRGRETSPCEYRIEISLDGEAWQTVADSHDRKPVNDRHREMRFIRSESTPEEEKQRSALYSQIADVDRKLDKRAPFPLWWIGNLVNPPKEQHVFLRGDPQKKGEEVQPASPQFLRGETEPFTLSAQTAENERRAALAEWIFASTNPLTPRVLANRLWQHHFGVGLVATPNDFGFMGGKPSHPKLLDYLARRLQQEDWQLKPLHREIMLSQTYRQSGAADPAAIAHDADCRLLWRFPPRRLSSEEIRDTLLSLADELQLKMVGPGFRLYDYLSDNVSTYLPLDRHDATTYRRAVYHQNVRAMEVDLMSDFDAPECAFSTPRRDNTTTPLQALSLWNHSFTLDMADHFADRLKYDTADLPAQVDRAFLLAFGRPASTTERQAAETLIRQHGLPAFCRALMNTNELIYLD
ncbi:MAG: DUF1553 domain-containing protein [Planctomycetota bacterium]|nr:DUF1553 domain-containing protein [Planctomycetota bacterium]